MYIANQTEGAHIKIASGLVRARCSFYTGLALELDEYPG